VIEAAYRRGCKFDAWDSEFDLDKWMPGFELADISPEFYGNTEWEYNDILPWDHISCGGVQGILDARSGTGKIRRIDA